MSIPSADDLYWYVAQNVVGRLNFVDCVIYEANDDQTELTQVAALGEKNPFGRSIVNPLRIPFGQGITGKVAQRREAIIVDDLADDESYIQDTQPARSEICVPMIFHNRVVGVIDSEHPDANAFGPQELEILTTVAAMTSAKLELLAEAERSNARYQDLVQSHAQLSQEIDNRKALESRLFEARKLESVGRLSGGFAHDFNNLLTVISGNLEFLQEAGGSLDENLDCIAAARSAADRGAQMIRNMLAFSQRSRLDPEPLDLNALTSETCAINKRALPATIAIQLQQCGQIWPVNVDKGASENALINLILNARDAMPDGGEIKVETANMWLSWTEIQSRNMTLRPGPYVCVSVSDTGTGIPEDRLQQIFDPFYTTKETGAGSGLGLSSTLGFMQQIGGSVIVSSEMGHGTTFRLYFPASPSLSLTNG